MHSKAQFQENCTGLRSWHVSGKPDPPMFMGENYQHREKNGHTPMIHMQDLYKNCLKTNKPESCSHFPPLKAKAGLLNIRKKPTVMNLGIRYTR